MGDHHYGSINTAGGQAVQAVSYQRTSSDFAQSFGRPLAKPDASASSHHDSYDRRGRIHW
jgi:hypothetical protein